MKRKHLNGTIDPESLIILLLFERTIYVGLLYCATALSGGKDHTLHETFGGPLAPPGASMFEKKQSKGAPPT